MKMKKAYAAALAAALMVTTAGFSVSAVNLTSTGTINLGPEWDVETTVTASGEDVAASLDGQALKNVTVNGYATEDYVDDKVGAVQKQLNDVAVEANTAVNWVNSKSADLENKVNQHIDNEGNISGANGTFTGDVTVEGNTTVNGHFDR